MMRIPYLVMPFVRGASLQKRIDSQGPLPLKDTLRIASQIAAGLAAAHEQGLVHRDIKPANILLEEGVERVTITDFGLARAVDDASMTCSGVIAGTPQYMSPEQARGEPIDARSDLFSLGGVLYAMCTGRSPFRAETTYGVLHRITNESPTSVCEVNSDVPVWLGHVIERLMAKRPEDRFGSAAEVAELLEGCLAHVQQPAAMPLPEAVAALAPKRARRPPIGKLLTAAAFAFAIIFAGVFVVLELNKGTLTIQSEVDDIRVRVTRGEQIVNELKVAKGEKSIRVAAGQYQVEVIGETDGLTVENGRVTLHRADSEVVRIVHESHNTNAVEDELVGNELLAQLQGTWYVVQVQVEQGMLIRKTFNAEVHGNRMELTLAGEGLMNFELVFGESGPPQQIDLRPVQDAAKREPSMAPSFQGIIAIGKDEFRVLTNVEPGADRPLGFTYATGPATGLIVWDFNRMPQNAKLSEADGVVSNSAPPTTGTGTLGSKQPANEKAATKRIPPGAHAIGGLVATAKFTSPRRTQTTVLQNGDLAYEAPEIQHRTNARIHLCKVTPASKFAERDKVEVIQTMSTNTEGRFANFVPPEFTSLFERDPSDPYLALVVEAEGCVTESMSAPPEHWNHEMNFGLESNEKPVRGQILVNGRPAGSVSVSVIGVQRAAPDELDTLLKRERLSPIDVKEPRKQAFLDGPDPEPFRLMKTNAVLSVEHKTTDSQGKFELRGFGPNDVLTLEIEGQGVEKTWLRVINRDIEPIHLRHRTGHIETYYGCGFIYDQTQVDSHIDSTAIDGTPSSAAMAKELDADARQAMSTHQNRLVWTNRFKFDSIRRYTHKEVGRVEERSTLASDGKRFVHRHQSLNLDQPADFFGRSLTSFALYTGDSFMGGTCLTGQPMKTGGYSRQNAEEHAWECAIEPA